MSETDRAPLIRLSVDQEVFIDTVREQDTIDDANVATEVTSFDRVGDAYVLEGAIVFAGYLTRVEGSHPAGATGDDALSFEFGDGEYVQHIHHRMPFVLRVPVKSQPRGIVNVASRISGWKLEVISAGWIRVTAELNITGLNGRDGYHFQCGAQEEGDVFFAQESPQELDAAFVSDSAEATKTQDKVNEANGQEPSGHVAEQEYLLVRGTPGEERDHETLYAKLHAVSEARAGQELVGEVDPVESNRPESAEYPERAQSELVNLDRLLEGRNGAVTNSEATKPIAQAADDENTPILQMSESETRSAESAQQTAFQPEFEVHKPAKEIEGPRTVAEFEFEHQVSSAEMQDELPPTRAIETFMASRSFNQEGFHATAGFVPAVRVGTAKPDNHEDMGATADNEGDASDMMRDAEENQMYPVDAGLWTFVDLTVPERYYTLRYAIVMEEETLEMVAERLGCLVSDLMRVNRLPSETVYPGQTLRVPARTAVAR